MKRCTPTPGIGIILSFVLCGPLWADTISSHGHFTTDDTVQMFTVNLAAPGAVTFQTFSYAGGTNGAGVSIAGGGFDPVLTLFDGAGNFLTTNDDGACGEVGTDAGTGNCFDSFLSLDLLAGSYTLALTEGDNLAIGPTLADGFLQTGNGNFTCAEFMGTSGGFCDASPSQRNDAWALDITTPGTTPSATPEPSTGILLSSGLAWLLVCGTKFRNIARQI